MESGGQSIALQPASARMLLLGTGKATSKLLDGICGLLERLRGSNTMIEIDGAGCYSIVGSRVRGATCLYTGLSTVSGMVYATLATSLITIKNGSSYLALTR
jgi:hypothetical protein